MNTSIISQQTFATMPITVLKGVGAKLAARLEKLGLRTIQDLLFHLPFRYQDRTRLTPIRNLRPGDYAVIEGIIELAEVNFKKRRSLMCYVSDASRTLTLRFFHFNAVQQQTLSQRGARIRCFGEVRFGKRGLEMIHPEYRLLQDEMGSVVENTLTPIYPATEGVSQLLLRKLTDQALQLLQQKPELLQEYLPSEILTPLKFWQLYPALHYIHRPPPDAPQTLLEEYVHPAQQRLAFEELLAHQLSLLRLRLMLQQQTAPAFINKPEQITAFQQTLPFTLTQAQQRVVTEIFADLVKPFPMLRLVQGDVGSGKTVVAALAAYQAILAGYQVAIMAPTELLAEQHYKNFSQWFANFSVNVILITGKQTNKQREIQLAEIVNHKTHLIIGTHALFQETVKFNKLGLIIVDEQHRFGVQQRLLLREKGRHHAQAPHQLIMTATPIPRTLAMTSYADLDCSIINELPPGRTPIITVAISNQRRDEVIQRVRENCAQGKQAYWICTLITESELLQCQAAEVTAQQLMQALPELRIGLLHGRLKPREKEMIMLAFKNKELDLLVATTVVEVGVDVPNATLMIIENPERLGLAQLHQLRGRVGRGHLQSHCVLLYQAPLSYLAKQRLNIMRESQDGFVIAEKDLEIRGPGEILGTRQTGLQQFKICDLMRNKNLLYEVQQLAPGLLQHHPAIVDNLIKRWLGIAETYQHV